MVSPRVSIVIPIYNGENFITDCLDSIEAQTYKDFEILVVNDGSTDMSLDVIENWKEKNPNLGNLRVFSTTNSGVSSARNTGILKSRGEFIAFLDCDDYWEPGKLDAQVKILDADSECIGSITNFFLVKNLPNGDRRRIRQINHGSIESLRIGWLSLLGNGGLISSSLVYRKNLEMLFSRDLSTAADLDFFLNLSSAGKMQIVQAPLVNYRIHGSQMHLNSTKLLHDYEILSMRLPDYGVSILEKVLMGNVFAMSALLEYSNRNIAKGFLFMRKSIFINIGSFFHVLTLVVWKRVRGKAQFLLWYIINMFRKN
jgi:glycosyltransferase involved in cell wall biosynthesis